jgi:CSLREA domain-containing protein
MKQKSTMKRPIDGTNGFANWTKLIIAAAFMLMAVCAASAATFTVSTTADSGDLVCDTDCSLREAITAANASSSDDTIIFAAGANGTIILSSSLPALANNGTLTITGNGPANTIISGSGQVRPFVVNGGGNVIMSGLTITDGNSPTGSGGAIINFGTLTVIDSMLSDNVAADSGGAIANFSTLTVTGSTMSGNTAARGGAIYLQDATATLTNTTISGSAASYGAGAISNLSGAGRSGSLTLISCTVTGNTGGSIGGVSAFDNGGSASVTTTLKNTILANNTNGQLYKSGANAHLVSLGYNLASDNGNGLLTGIGDQINTDPMLGPLADNGGPTLTHKLLDGSPAIDGGMNSNGLLTDQRGVGFARTVDLGAVNAGDGTDIGAFEVQNSLFNFTGFFQPVDNLPTVNIVNAGQAVPMKFSLGGDQGLNIFAPGYPVSSPVTCEASEPGSTIEETVNAGGSSLSYDQATDRYSYVWSTNRAWNGTCRMFVLRLSDGSEHYAKFRFR